MSNFGSYVKALRKASTHLTEEPYLYYQHSLICIITITLLYYENSLICIITITLLYYENSLIFIIITFLFMLLSHLYLSVTPQTCSSVTLSSNTRNLLTRQLVNLSTCHVTLSPITSNLFTSLLVNLLTYIVTLSLVNLVTKKTEERQLYRYLRITIVSRR